MKSAFNAGFLTKTSAKHKDHITEINTHLHSHTHIVHTPHYFISLSICDAIIQGSRNLNESVRKNFLLIRKY